MSNFYIWPDMPMLSIAVLVAASMFFLYLARTPLHLALDSLDEGIAGGMKSVSDWIKTVVSHMQEKNRKVLLESNIAESEQKITQEFKRVESSFTKHLTDYPALHLKLDEGIANIDSDYKECGQAIPEVPGWNDAVESIANIKGSASGDRVIENMLKELHKSAVEGEKQALAEMRKISTKRHKILSGMSPIWNKLVKVMNEVDKKISLVIETSSKIERYMQEFEKVRAGGDDKIDMLSSKAT